MITVRKYEIVLSTGSSTNSILSTTRQVSWFVFQFVNEIHYCAIITVYMNTKIQGCGQRLLEGKSDIMASNTNCLLSKTHVIDGEAIVGHQETPPQFTTPCLSMSIKHSMYYQDVCTKQKTSQPYTHTEMSSSMSSTCVLLKPEVSTVTKTDGFQQIGCQCKNECGNS